jgi:two-component system response regulator MprA
MDSEARRASVLIVDDQRVVLRTFARAIQSLGYEARVADNADAALESVRMDPPDAILLDLTMPFVNGIGLLYRLRGAAPQIPVAIVTGTAVSKETQDELDALGATVHLKPLTPAQIEDVIKTLLGLTPEPSRRPQGPSCIFCGHGDTQAVTRVAGDVGAQFECANCCRRFVVKSSQPW